LYYIIRFIDDRSGYAQQTVDFHCRQTLSAGTASASSRNPLYGVFRHVLFPQESSPSVPINEAALSILFLPWYPPTQQMEYARLLWEDRSEERRVGKERRWRAGRCE